MADFQRFFQNHLGKLLEKLARLAGPDDEIVVVLAVHADDFINFEKHGGQLAILIAGHADRQRMVVEQIANLRQRTDGGDPRVVPREYQAIAEDAEVQPPFTLPMRLGNGTVTVAWAVLRPRPVVANATRVP